MNMSSEDGIEDLVYALVSLIPEGLVSSYSAIAELIGIDPRRVARILSRNPMPIAVPCHRVVYKNGRLGGYTPWGPEFKLKLLRFEGVPIVGGRVDKSRIIVTGKDLYRIIFSGEPLRALAPSHPDSHRRPHNCRGAEHPSRRQ